MIANRFTKCQICRTPYKKWSSTQRTCHDITCALKLAKLDREKKERKADKDTRERLKSRREWLKDAQTAFNFFIRKRDRNKLCICCNMPLAENAIGGGFDCGHYRSIGSAPHLRFDPRNAAGQRKQCNRWGSGRAVDYRLGLIARIGLAEVESLEADQTTRKYTIPELQEIIKIYKQKTKELT